jgi:DNA mismatch repair ATPase MutL
MSTATLHPTQQQQRSRQQSQSQSQPQPQPQPQPSPQRAASAQGHRQYLRTSNPHNSRSASHPHPSRQHEKSLVLKYADSGTKTILAPEEISKDLQKKEVGRSSRHLKVDDFELMRTLGTGTETLALIVLSRLVEINSCQVHSHESGSVVSQAPFRQTGTKSLL